MIITKGKLCWAWKNIRGVATWCGGPGCVYAGLCRSRECINLSSMLTEIEKKNKQKTQKTSILNMRRLRP